MLVVTCCFFGGTNDATVRHPDLAANRWPLEQFERLRSVPKPSLMATIMTKKIWNKYKHKATKATGWTLARAINTGCLYPDSEIGCHIGDSETLDMFKALFVPLIEKYHGCTQHNSALLMEPLQDVAISPAAQSKVSFSRVRVIRNLTAFPLNTGGTVSTRTQLARTMQQVVRETHDELPGSLTLNAKTPTVALNGARVLLGYVSLPFVIVFRFFESQY